jgi:hypothetical protein
MSQWNHIIVEAFCGRTWKPIWADKYHYEFDDRKKFTFKRVANKLYKPGYKTPRKPKYCPGDTPEYVCLEKNCPHLAYCNADKKDYKTMLKAWFKSVKKI